MRASRSCSSAAHRGTLFLDEIGELPPSQQGRFLRAVEEGQITPIGADEPVPCQVRLVAATHRDLAGEQAGDAGADRRVRG